jgi:Effector-associated domain 11
MNFDWLKKFLNIYTEKPEVYIRVEAADKGKIEEIKSAVAQAETGTALEILEGFNIYAIENEAIALSSRYQSLQNDQLSGIISTEEYRLQINRIHHSILALVSRLEKNLEPEKVIREIKVCVWPDQTASAHSRANIRAIKEKSLVFPVTIALAFPKTATSSTRLSGSSAIAELLSYLPSLPHSAPAQNTPPAHSPVNQYFRSKKPTGSFGSAPLVPAR